MEEPRPCRKWTAKTGREYAGRDVTTADDILLPGQGQLEDVKAIRGKRRPCDLERGIGVGERQIEPLGGRVGLEYRLIGGGPSLGVARRVTHVRVDSSQPGQ